MRPATTTAPTSTTPETSPPRRNPPAAARKAPRPLRYNPGTYGGAGTHDIVRQERRGPAARGIGPGPRPRPARPIRPRAERQPEREGNRDGKTACRLADDQSGRPGPAPNPERPDAPDDRPADRFSAVGEGTRRRREEERSGENGAAVQVPAGQITRSGTRPRSLT